MMSCCNAQALQDIASLTQTFLGWQLYASQAELTDLINGLLHELHREIA